MLRLAGPVTPLRAPEHRPFRTLRRRPAEVRAGLGTGLVLALATRRPLGERLHRQLRHLNDQPRARVLLLPLAGPAELVIRPEALARDVRTAARHLPDGTLVVSVPLPRRTDPGMEPRARVVVPVDYGAPHLLADYGLLTLGPRDRSVNVSPDIGTEAP